MTGLAWLPEPGDWPARLAALARAPDWDAAVALAGTRLDFLRTHALDAALRGAWDRMAAPEPLRLAVLGSATMDHLAPGLRIGALRRGLRADLWVPPFGQYRQALLAPPATFRPDVVLLALDAHHLTRVADPAMTASEAAAAATTVVEDLRRLWAATPARVIQQAPLPVLPALMGQNEHALPGAPAALLRRIDAALRDAAAADGVAILDAPAWAARDGLAAWHDPALWLVTRQDIRPPAAPLYGDLVARLLAAMQGRSARCLVLDLDNTIWGGVAGEDGTDGLELGPGTALGEAFAAMQRYAKGLAARGIALAVCSKNDPDRARAAFRDHRGMILREEDIACFLANWDDKPSNLRAIAGTLNLGLDSLVFVDDTRFERELVRRELPMVMVPELGDDPALYPATLAESGYFEAVAITEQDRRRSASYAANRVREAGRGTDLDAWLRDLDMRLDCRPFDRAGLGRIAQLVAKSNQFNLTTRRRTEAELAALMDDGSRAGLQLRLTDRFGDNGMIAVVILADAPERSLHIDTWLMSCRVLGRGVEQATLAMILREARRRGAGRITGEYIPTPRNGMVADLYPRLGFAALSPGRFVRDAALAIDPGPITLTEEIPCTTASSPSSRTSFGRFSYEGT